MVKKPRVPVPLSRTEQRLSQQLSFLRKSCAEYDSGDTSEFLRLASCVRVLVHYTKTSHSLMGQPELSDTPFASYARHIPGNLIPELVIITLGASSVSVAPLLDSDATSKAELPFSEWWNEIVLIDGSNQRFTRRDLVLTAANQDGGAHADPKIDKDYLDLAQGVTSPFVFGDEVSSVFPLLDFEKATIRHIAHEVQLSLGTRWDHVLGNRGCPCGSGRKARYCCRKT